MLTVEDLFDWGSLDVEKLEEFINAARKFGIDIDEIRDNIASFEGDITDINAWLYSVVSLLFYRITDELSDYVENLDLKPYIKDLISNYIEDLRDNFCPYINCLDTWFNNILDEIDLTQSKSQILKDLFERICETLGNEIFEIPEDFEFEEEEVDE